MLCDLPEDLLVQISCAFYLFDTDKDGLLKPKDFLKIYLIKIKFIFVN